jgi:hypothetical protein
MALYAVSNQNDGTPQATSTTYKTQISLTAATATLRRAFIYEWDIGADGLPNATDCAIVWDLSAQTAAGTGTASVPELLDAADTAAGTVGTVDYTAEGTITASSSRWTLGANQRASYRWVVNPGGPGEITIPATNAVGFALRAKSTTYTGTLVATMFFRE